MGLRGAGIAGRHQPPLFNDLPALPAPPQDHSLLLGDALVAAPSGGVALADQPVLGDLASSVTFGINQVLAAPQIIDNSVSFSDPADDLAGGTLTVSGLLHEDVVAVQDQGTDPGQIGVSGTDITYGGTIIGSVAGGDGSDLTITFNAAATSAGVQALIEDLAYTDTAASPTASRDLLFDIQDGGGLDVSQTVTIALTANSPPTIDLDSTDAPPAVDATAVWGQGEGPLAIAPNGIVDDADQPADYAGYTLTVAFTANGTAADQLGIESTGFGPNDLHVSGGEIFYGGTEVATYSGGDNGTALTISFNNNACACSVDAVVEAITYANDAASPSTLDRGITFTVDDGLGDNSTASAVATVHVVANDAPVLTGLDSSVTFAENLVNATPQLLAPNATLTDTEGNFDGGALTVTGLLGEDFVGLANVGTGAHEISVSGHDVSYEGTLIGSYFGGHGDPLVVVFNSDATTESVQAVIDNLTYSDTSDAPTTSRELIVNVYDSFGADLGISPSVAAETHFQPLFGSQNPLVGVGVYGFAAPAFVDIDGDGDMDAVVGDSSGHLALFTNDHGIFTQAPDDANPFAGITTDYFAKPAFVDIDGDGDLDLVVGGYSGNLQVFENDHGVFTELTGAANPLDGVHVVGNAAPAFVDLDGDGDLDLVVGDAYGDLHAFQNDHGTFTELTGAANPFENIHVDGLAAPAFVDLDGDGDLDLVVGDAYGDLLAFRNDGGAFHPMTGAADPLNGLFPGYGAAPAFVDVDGDGRLDLVVGNYDGALLTALNATPHGLAIDVNVTPQNDPPSLDLDATAPGLDVSAAFIEGDPPLAIAPFAIFDDPDEPADYGGYVVTAALTANGDTDDVLSIADIGTGPGEISVSGSDLLYQGVVVGSFAGGANGAPLVITFNSAACACSVEATLEDILFSNGSDDPSGSTRTVTFTVDDGSGGTASANATIAVTQVNDAPDASVPAEQFDASGSNFVFDATHGNAIVISDPDAAGGNETVTLSAAHGTLTLSTENGLTGVSGDGTATVTFTGTLADINAALNGVTYLNDANYSGPDTLSVTVDDNGNSGSGGAQSVTQTVPITVVPAGFIIGDFNHTVLTGTPGADMFWLAPGQSYDVTGLGGSDLFYFGVGGMTSADQVDGGPGADQIALQGDYWTTPLTLGAGVVNIESIYLMAGNDTRAGDTAGNHYSYDIVTGDANVAAGQQLTVDGSQLRSGEDFTFDGSAETNGFFYIYAGAGVDTLTGGHGNDVFLFNAGTLGPRDHVDGGPGNDQLALRGDYDIVFGDQMTSIESLYLVSAHDRRLAGGGTDFTYNLTMNDANVAAGQQMTVDGSALRSAETLTFDGSAETNGSYRVFGGAGNDVITGSHGNDILVGGSGADTLTGGEGNDTFLYRNLSESTPTSHDTITDFTSGDVIDLSMLDADTKAGMQHFTFIGSAAFDHHAGELQAINTSGDDWTISGDVNGDGVADFQIMVHVADHHPLTAGDFHL